VIEVILCNTDDLSNVHVELSISQARCRERGFVALGGSDSLKPGGMGRKSNKFRSVDSLMNGNTLSLCCASPHNTYEVDVISLPFLVLLSLGPRLVPLCFAGVRA
jgi:hypothetical protein